MKFVYLVMSYPADSCYPFSNHISDEAPTHIYAVYHTMNAAVACLGNIYARQILGVKHGTEYAIIKRKFSDASLHKETSMTEDNQEEMIE